MIVEGELKLESIIIVSEDTYRYRFSNKKNFSFLAGQFLMIQFSEKIIRAYSIASPVGDSVIEFIVKLLPEGRASNLWKKIKIGDILPFKGAFGSFLLSETKETQLYFLGTGTGIAPLRSMILTESKKESPRKMTLFYGGRTSNDVGYLEEIPKWNKDLNFYFGFSREKKTDESIDSCNCRVTELIQPFQFETKNSEFYICGSPPVVESIIKILNKKGVPNDSIFHEKYG